MRRPFMLWLLVFLLLILALGGFYGGIAILIDPTGSSLELDDVIHLLPVSDYILAGIFLFMVMGLFPLLITYALIARPSWSWVDSLFQWSKHYWAWSATLILAVILAIWLAVEGMLIGFFPITNFMAALGLLIFVFAFLPGVRNFYAN